MLVITKPALIVDLPHYVVRLLSIYFTQQYLCGHRPFYLIQSIPMYKSGQ